MFDCTAMHFCDSNLWRQYCEAATEALVSSETALCSTASVNSKQGLLMLMSYLNAHRHNQISALVLPDLDKHSCVVLTGQSIICRCETHAWPTVGMTAMHAVSKISSIDIIILNDICNQEIQKRESSIPPGCCVVNHYQLALFCQDLAQVCAVADVDRHISRIQVFSILRLLIAQTG
jgi:hypothetical protein